MAVPMRGRRLEECTDAPIVQGLIAFLTKECHRRLEDVLSWSLVGYTSDAGEFHVRFTDETGVMGSIAQLPDETWKVVSFRLTHTVGGFYPVVDLGI